MSFCIGRQRRSRFTREELLKPSQVQNLNGDLGRNGERRGNRELGAKSNRIWRRLRRVHEDQVHALDPIQMGFGQESDGGVSILQFVACFKASLSSSTAARRSISGRGQSIVG